MHDVYVVIQDFIEDTYIRGIFDSQSAATDLANELDKDQPGPYSRYRVERYPMNKRVDLL